jgi:hypothetical protein
MNAAFGLRVGFFAIGLSAYKKWGGTTSRKSRFFTRGRCLDNSDPPQEVDETPDGRLAMAMRGQFTRCRECASSQIAGFDGALSVTRFPFPPPHE